MTDDLSASRCSALSLHHHDKNKQCGSALDRKGKKVREDEGRESSQSTARARRWWCHPQIEEGGVSRSNFERSHSLCTCHAAPCHAIPPMKQQQQQGGRNEGRRRLHFVRQSITFFAPFLSFSTPNSEARAPSSSSPYSTTRRDAGPNSLELHAL